MEVYQANQLTDRTGRERAGYATNQKFEPDLFFSKIGQEFVKKFKNCEEFSVQKLTELGTIFLQIEAK